MLPLLLELMPSHDRYVEVFGGGGTLLFNKNLSNTEVFNDVDRRLTNLLEVVRDNPEEFSRQLKFLPRSSEFIAKFKRDEITETDQVKRAVMRYYLLCNSFSGIVRSGDSASVLKRDKSSLKEEEDIEWFSNRLRHVIIENMDFQDLIEKYDSPQTFFFSDPPYISAGPELYDFHFKSKDHIRFARAIKAIKGLFLITYDDHPLAQMLFRDYFTIQHSTPQVGALHKLGSKAGEVAHLIISNYDIDKRNFKKFHAKYYRF